MDKEKKREMDAWKIHPHGEINQLRYDVSAKSHTYSFIN